jgi:non-ribosomal peptide synthetase component F/SAM-dependent methyltransferase/acyl carrier protein
MTADAGNLREDVNIFDTGRFQREYLFWADHQDFESAVLGLKGLVDAVGTVLDTGCGDGRMAIELGKMFRLVIGFDLSPRMIAKARKRALEAGASNVHFLVGDIAHPALAPSSFDLVFSSYALHETFLDASLPSLAQLLKPGGCVYAQEPEGPPTAWLPSLWYRWLGLKDAQAALRRHGFGTAWRIFVFGQRNAWIRHQVDDEQWPLSVWRERIQQILPGAVVVRPRQGTVRFLWRRPAEAQPATGLTGLPVPHSGGQDAVVPRTRVLRGYPKAAPMDHVPFPREALEGSVVARFERMAREFAARPALRTSARQWSYAELDAAANRVARGILKRGGASPVALLMDQDDPAVPALLGVLKAGRPYVFLDPDDSAGRWEDVLHATGAEQLVAPAVRIPLLGKVRTGSCAVLEYEDLEGGSLSEDPGLEIGPDSLAAVFFTSGSTGRPKGVLRDHRQFLHSTWLNTNTYFVSPSDRQTLLYFPGFTASVPNIYDTILNGAALCCANPRRMTPRSLLDWARAEGITHFNPPVGLWRGLVESASSADAWPDLRLVTLGGQALYGSDLREFQSRFGGAVLLFVLAMTEAGAVTQAFVDQTVVAEDGPVPAGYPVADKEVAILDPEGGILGRDEAGRIAITSAYLSRGYWRDEAGTLRSFRPHGEDGRLKTFLTGDRGLIRPDGCLEYFGRDDSVVKIRGYRVDTAAVEAVLNAHPSISAAVVAAGTWRSVEPTLAAYVVVRGEGVKGSQGLRSYVTERLPAYMAPDHVVFLESLPLTPSGKVDRLALPAPGRSRPALNSPFVPPRNELEDRVAHIWKELLELDDVGVHDDFFDLGGDSLLAMRMALAVESALGRPVPPDFFRHSTVASLSGAFGDEKSAVAPTGTAGLAAGLEGGPRKYPKAFRRFLSDGPLLGGLCLPYGFGVRLQAGLLGNPLLRRRYADRLAVLHSWAEELGVATPPVELSAACLLANTWRIWRAKALESADVIGKWLRISDPHGYLSDRSTHGGVVLAVPHAGRIGGVLLGMFERRGQETEMVANAAWLGQDDGSEGWRIRQTRSRSGMMFRAKEVLQRGGAVYISPDGLQGQQTVEAEFVGRRRPFQLGAAELAVTTGAAFVPVFVRFDVEGRVWVDVAEALTGYGETPQERIVDLTLRYAREYSARWPHFFASMDWKHLKYNLALPRN